jgi:hypothetical protein
MKNVKVPSAVKVMLFTYLQVRREIEAICASEPPGRQHPTLNVKWKRYGRHDARISHCHQHI